MKTTKEKTILWKRIAGAVLLVQLVASAVLFSVLLWLAVVPTRYLVLLALVLLWLVIVEYLLFYIGGKKQSKTVRRIKRVSGGLLAALTISSCLAGSVMLEKAGSTLRDIADNVELTDTVSAYVLADDPAESLEDAADYVFAITEAYDSEHTKKAIAEIETLVGHEILTQTYDSVTGMVQALYDKTADAMLMNIAYVDLVEAQEGFEDFSEKTKVLYAHEETTVVEQSTQTAEKSITTDPFVVYISGSDTRSTSLSYGRSDVNILAAVNPVTKQVLLINTPRDAYVETAASAGQSDKLTHCGMYGITCSMETLANLYGVDVDYYAQINFSGFETLVDAVGGITVESEKSFTTSEGGYYIAKGENRLSGAVALSYVRERKAFADGDNSRGRHQMQAITALIGEISSGTTILSNYTQIMDSMSGMFATNMSTQDLSALVKMQLTDMASWNVCSYAATGTGGRTTTYSMPTQKSYVIYLDDASTAHAAELIDKVENGEALTDADMEIPQEE